MKIELLMPPGRPVVSETNRKYYSTRNETITYIQITTNSSTEQRLVVDLAHKTR